MPIHDTIASRFPLLDGIESFADVLVVSVDDRLAVQLLVPGMLHGFPNLTSKLPPVDDALALLADVVIGAGACADRLVSA
jgi:hypothetical protein